MGELSYRKRSRVDSDDPEFNVSFTKEKKIRDDLLGLLNDSDTVPDLDSVSQDLDSVIRSFEEVIESSESNKSSPVIVIDLTGDTCDVTAEYVEAEAEAGGGDGSELVKVSSELDGLSELWDFEDEFTGYDSFGVNGYDSSEYVALDGIFDYSDVSSGPDFLWRPDTLPAL